MANNINKYVEEANRFFNNVAVELGTPGDFNRATRVTTAVLHTIRERITPEESMHLISQLPMILKGIYVDGWKITMKLTEVDTLDEFLDQVRVHDLGAAEKDFGNDQQAREAVKAVLKVINGYVSIGEVEDIKAQLPRPIAALFD